MTEPATVPHAPRLELDTPALKSLGDALREAGFDHKSVLQRIGVGELHEIGRTSAREIRERTDEGSPLDILIRLFLVGEPVTPIDLAAAIPKADLRSLASCGVLSDHAQGVVSPFQIVPFMGLHVLYDRRPTVGDMPRDFVMGIGGSTQTLAIVTVRKPCESAMDMGAGCGVHAMLAARHARRVVAVDINPRAILMTNANAAINGITNIEAREGSFFAPVEGERFDLIVANPPFVISPESTYTYRDAALPSDGVMELVCREGLKHLRPGGVCQVLGNWVSLEDEPEEERLPRWFDDAPCTVIAHRSHDSTPRRYAEHWTAHTSLGEEITPEQRIERWVEHFAQQRITVVHNGQITIRRESDPPATVFIEPVAEKWRIRGAASEHLESLLDSLRAIAVADAGGGLLAAKLQVCPEVRIAHQLMPTSDEQGGHSGWEVTDTHISLTRGIANAQTLDPLATQLVMACDGRRTLREILDELAGTNGYAASEFITAAEPVARRLAQKGFFRIEPN